MFLQVYNPLNQNQNNLQGTMPSLQGSGSALQGAGMVQGPQPKPVVVAQPKAQAPKPAAISPVVPAPAQVQPAPALPDVLSFMNEQVNPYTGQVLSQSQPQAQAQPTPSTSNASPQNQNQVLAKYAGQAGLDPKELAQLLGLSGSEQQSIYDQMGVSQLAQQVFSPPSKSTEQLYNDAYAQAGLKDIKDRFTALQEQINKRNEALTAQLGKVNENPWLDEASRVGRAKRLQELAQAEIANIAQQAQQYADLYNQGLEQVNGVVTRSSQDFSNNQKLNEAKLQYLISQADKRIQNEQQSKVSRYLPDYLQAAAASKKPDTLTLEDGSVVRWNPSTASFDTVYQGQNIKNQPASYQEYILAKQDGFTGNYNDYQTMDANRKRSIAVTNIAGANGLNSKQTSNFLTISNKYQADSVIQAGQKGQSAVEIADQVLANPKNAGNQLSILYTLVKSLDPDSAVREGEIALAQQTQSYFSKFKTNLERISQGQVISESAAKELANATKNLAKVWYGAAQRRQQQYQSQAQVTGIGDAFNEYLGGFSQPFSTNSGQGSTLDSLRSKYGF